MTDADKPRFARMWLVTTVIVIVVVLALVALAIPSFVKKRSMTAQEMCIEALRQIDDGGTQQRAFVARTTNTGSEKK
jgi:hypothetical protein